MELMSYSGNPLPKPTRTQLSSSLDTFEVTWIQEARVLKMTVNIALNKASLRGAGVSCPLLCAKKVRDRINKFLRIPC